MGGFYLRSLLDDKTGACLKQLCEQYTFINLYDSQTLAMLLSCELFAVFNQSAF